MLKNIAKKVLPPYLVRLIREFRINYCDSSAIKSYSQEGEDLILLRILGYKRSGFYVDVGAHHPKRFSNTYLFYKLGWRGINIDPTPGSMKLFNKFRPRDINLEVGVSDSPGFLKFYMFNEPALNTFDEELARERDGKNRYRIVKVEKVKLDTLENILDKHLPKNTEIDFLSVDVEGLDFQVLKSNNWDKYKPKVVIVEILRKPLEELLDDEITLFMRKNGYKLFAKTLNSVFFSDEDFLYHKFGM